MILADIGQAQPIHHPFDPRFDLVKVVGVEFLLDPARLSQEAVIHLIGILSVILVHLVI